MKMVKTTLEALGLETKNNNNKTTITAIKVSDDDYKVLKDTIHWFFFDTKNKNRESNLDFLKRELDQFGVDRTISRLLFRLTKAMLDKYYENNIQTPYKDVHLKTAVKKALKELKLIS